MLRLLGLLLVIWLAVSIIGAVIEGLFWLTVVGLLFFTATAVNRRDKRKDDPALPRGR